ncbi:MAG: fibrinogen-like YCDxxxxGGGW domain-containing protein, partial [Candidatus Gracilibacteria bacterium]|nr:fibrinogen-like YCDxxxxGGGW domain-containing protein [Candidatus Gracilibacteria bacterium]
DGSTLLSLNAFVPNASADIGSDYSKRYPSVQGDTLGILLGNSETTLNQPIQESGTGVDVVKTNSGYVAVFGKGDSNQVSGTGSKLFILEGFMRTGMASSCNDLAQFDINSQKDGIYTINPKGGVPFQVYCDMTSDGGGWTLIMKLKSGNNTEFAGNQSMWGNSNTISEMSCLDIQDNNNCRNTAYSSVGFNKIKIENNINGKILIGFDTHSNSVSQRVNAKTPFYGNLESGGIANLWSGMNSCNNIGLIDKSYDYGFYVADKSHVNKNVNINGWVPGYGWLGAVIGYGNNQSNGPSGYNTVGGIGAFSPTSGHTTSFSRHYHTYGDGCGISWTTTPEYNTKPVFLYVK